MVGTGDAKGFGEAAGACAAVFGQFESAEEDEALALGTFDQHVEEPVHAVIEIDVGGAGRMVLDEAAGGRAVEGMTGSVVLRIVGFGFDDAEGLALPDEPCADEGAGTEEGGLLKECGRQPIAGWRGVQWLMAVGEVGGVVHNGDEKSVWAGKNLI